MQAMLTCGNSPAAGYLADRYSSKVVLEVGVWTWSLFTMLTPLAAQSHLWVLLLTHFLTGVGEGMELLHHNHCSCEKYCIGPALALQSTA